ncbi:hypothetical protein BCR44DRAFT_36874 [Catenaria anguillulae PL171]|uniref:VWFD domain-containing protein n=1 Tax=Catenaria anguillulae PL171 TaxID=765915 RepID=A0A1Y2H9V0_9FUNG|nr:hypothetical protein BCR44DRAFT_36874 [Catenaria anguillulae PL171]
MHLTFLSTLAFLPALAALQASATIWFRDLRTRAPITGALYLPHSYFGTTIGISLRERPAGPVVVAWGAENSANGNRNETLYPSDQKCTTIFTPANWNVTQSLTLANPMRASLARDALTAPVKFQAFSSECGYKDHGNVVTLEVNRQAFPNTQCSIKTALEGGAEGMNIKAFGDVAYHFLGEGQFYILQSDSLAIITDLRRCSGVNSGGRACMNRLAIVLNGSTIYFDPFNLVQSRLAQSTAPMSMSTSPSGGLPAGVSITKYKVNARSEQVTLALRTGLSIQVTVTGGNRPAINELLIRPDLELAQRGVTNGWCGAFDVSLRHDQPVDMFRAGTVLYESKQLARDAATVSRTSPQYAATTLVKFVQSTRVPANMNPFASGYVQPRMVLMGPGLMTNTCPAVNQAEYTCSATAGAPKPIGFTRAGMASQSSAVQDESLFAAGSAHCFDGADCDSLSVDDADDALFSVDESSVLSDGFTDAVDQFWEELGSDEY